MNIKILDKVTKEVRLDGMDITVIVDKDHKSVSVAHLCDEIGINYGQQRHKILDRFDHTVVTADFGEYRCDVLAIPEWEINPWLFSINTKRVKDERAVIKINSLRIRLAIAVHEVGSNPYADLLNPSHDNLSTPQKNALQKVFYGWPDGVVEDCDKRIAELHQDIDLVHSYSDVSDQNYFDVVNRIYNELGQLTIVRNTIQTY